MKNEAGTTVAVPFFYLLTIFYRSERIHGEGKLLYTQV